MKRIDHIRTCRRKRKYGWLEANIKVKKLNAEGEYLNVYKCRNCGGYHIGHPSPQKRVRMAFKRMEKAMGNRR